MEGMIGNGIEGMSLAQVILYAVVIVAFVLVLRSKK